MFRKLNTDVLFWWKRRVVLMKVTCCFVENDVLFWWKWRVVLMKMTCRFWWTIRSGICPIGKRKSVRTNQSSEVEIFICENTYNRLSRVHAYAHITGVLLFLLSQVSHGYWLVVVLQSVMVCFWSILTIRRFNPSFYDETKAKKWLSIPSFFPDFSFFFLPLSFPVWHLWQQKNNIVVERRALRVRARKTY